MEQTDIDKINMLAEPLVNYLQQINEPYVHVVATSFSVNILTLQSHMLASND